jgi:proline iminopeptidase
MRYFSRGHRCIAYSARGYTPSDVPTSAESYSYRHFYTDALAVLDHLRMPKAHFVGLSMGSYSSMHAAMNAPERVLSMTLAGVGSGSSLWKRFERPAATPPINSRSSARWKLPR